MTVAVKLAESGAVPDLLLRWGIRRMLAERLREERRGGPAAVAERRRLHLADLERSPVALHTDAANEQHYALPPAFFEQVLGPHLKYSACLWNSGTNTIGAAEAAMLECYGARAELMPGQHVLDLGCGWGSFTLWGAAQFPTSSFLAVSNSPAQIAYVRTQAMARGLDNVDARVADVNDFAACEAYDRIVSVEMLEHVRNYRTLFERIAGWLTPSGKFFAHVFCHRELLYPFETDGDNDWMARHFFTGGLMPSADTLPHFQEHLHLERRWLLDGNHYARTAQSWLTQFDANAASIETILSEVYGENEIARWMQRWRMFFMACEELFGYRSGTEWLVGHYRFVRP